MQPIAERTLIGIIELEVILVCVAILGVLFVQMSVRRRRLQFERLREELAGWLVDALLEAPARRLEPPASLRRVSADVGRNVLVDLGEQLAHDDRALLRQLHRKLAWHKRARRDCKGSRWKRLRAVREARALNDPGGVLDRLSRDPVAEVRLAAFEALCDQRRYDVAIQCLATLQPALFSVRMRILDALQSSEGFPARALADLIPTASAALRSTIIDGLGVLLAQPLLENILESLDDPSTEVRAAALRALNKIGDPLAAERCASRLGDASWLVRMWAVKTLVALAGDRMAGAIAPLLEDEEEWVRHHAGLALASCGPAGLQQLRSERYAQAPAAQSALAEYAIRGG